MRPDRDAVYRVGGALLEELPARHLRAHAAHPQLLLLPGREHPLAVQQGPEGTRRAAHTEDRQEERRQDRPHDAGQTGLCRRGDQERRQ